MTTALKTAETGAIVFDLAQDNLRKDANALFNSRKAETCCLAASADARA